MQFSRLLINSRTIVLTGVLCLATAFAMAQSERPVSINVGGGFSPLVGNLSNHLNNGWHVTGGVKYNPTKTFSIGPQFTYNGFGVPGSVLREARAPNGDAHVWSITADPRLQLPFPKLRPYLVGGVGYYRRTVNFTQPALINVTFFDPFFGYIFPGVVGTNQVLKSITRNGIGGSLGAGFGFKLGKTGTEFFTEARYHYAATGNIPTRMIPVTFGLRF
ncbi:MAG TPA: outer membrane beta-barrel protein [Terriglobales bacterium]|nr:outer membrane beta-barrel protein [Terriglobales bacterium]